MSPRPLRLVLDDIFFCWADSGIARVWNQVLAEWSARDLPAEYGVEVILLNRSGRVESGEFRSLAFPSRTWDDAFPAADRLMLDRLCHEVSADVFVSTYYTLPFGLPSLTTIYDLIPERFGFDIMNRTWIERKLAIALGRRFATISHSTRDDLLGLYPHVEPSSVGVAHPGIDSMVFTRVSDHAVADFRTEHGLTRRYIVMPGTRHATNEYKNGRILFEHLGESHSVDYDIVLTGGEPATVEEMEICTRAGVRLLRLQLDDAELATCLSGANAVVYPSLHEGFGLPPLEALAVGTPVVTSDSPTVRESTGDLAVTFQGRNPHDFGAALAKATSDEWCETIRARGPERARTFTWEPFSRLVLEQAVRAARDPSPMDTPGLGNLLREYQAASLILQ